MTTIENILELIFLKVKIKTTHLKQLIHATDIRVQLQVTADKLFVASVASVAINDTFLYMLYIMHMKYMFGSILYVLSKSSIEP